MHERAKLHDVHIENLELIGQNPDVKTFELLIPPEHYNYVLSYWLIASEALDILDKRLKAIHSLEEIIINFEKNTRDLGWVVRVTRLPKRVWISNDGQVEFENEEVCYAYDGELLRRHEEMDKKLGNELWLEEHYERRNDPYWKNDSDYEELTGFPFIMGIMN